MGAKEGIQIVHNEYTYDEQRVNLVEIRHNTDGNAANDVVYSFEQDALGCQTGSRSGIRPRERRFIRQPSDECLFRHLLLAKISIYHQKTFDFCNCI